MFKLLMEVLTKGGNSYFALSCSMVRHHLLADAAR